MRHATHNLIRSALSIGAIAGLFLGAGLAAKPRPTVAALIGPRDVIIAAKTIATVRIVACSSMSGGAGSRLGGVASACPGTVSPPRREHNQTYTNRLALAF